MLPLYHFFIFCQALYFIFIFFLSTDHRSSLGGVVVSPKGSIPVSFMNALPRKKNGIEYVCFSVRERNEKQSETNVYVLSDRFRPYGSLRQSLRDRRLLFCCNCLLCGRRRPAAPLGRARELRAFRAVRSVSLVCAPLKGWPRLVAAFKKFFMGIFLFFPLFFVSFPCSSCYRSRGLKKATNRKVCGNPELKLSKHCATQSNIKEIVRDTEKEMKIRLPTSATLYIDNPHTLLFVALFICCLHFIRERI